MKYESAILKRLIDTYGVVGNPRYISEIIKEFIVRGKECFPELFTYQSDWLAHIDEFGLNPSYTVGYTGQSFYAPNTLERPVKSAILSGSTKYRDIDTGEILETFEEGRNLELVSVKMPVLTTSNEDGTKTNILTVNEPVELRGIGGVQDTLDCLTGELTQRIGEIVLDGSEDWIGTAENYRVKIPNVKGYKELKWGQKSAISNLYPPFEGVEMDSYIISEWEGNQIRVHDINTTLEELKTKLAEKPLHVIFITNEDSVKTVDLTILDQNGQNVKQLMSFNGGTHFNTGSLESSLIPSVSVTVETDLEETLKVCSLEGNTM